MNIVKILPIICFSFLPFLLKAQSTNSINPKMEEVEIVSLLETPNQTGFYTLVLRSLQDTIQHISVEIGKQEALVLTIALQNMKPTAPLPLDVLQNAIFKFGYVVDKISINGSSQKMYAIMDCTNKNKELVSLEMRVAEAVTMAVKSQKSIWISSELLYK